MNELNPHFSPNSPVATSVRPVSEGQEAERAMLRGAERPDLLRDEMLAEIFAADGRAPRRPCAP